MRAPVRLGLVGCGRLAELGYLPAVARAERMDLVAVADPDVGRRERVAELAAIARQAPVASFGDAAALVDGADLDAVVVASPVAAHLDDARAVAASGAAVLVEKPPARDAAGAAELATILPVPWVGFNRRFDLGARAVRAAVPYTSDVELVLRIAYRRRSWRAHVVHDDALLDLGPHLADWAGWITGGHVTGVRDARLSRERATFTLELTRGRARAEAACNRPYLELVELRDSRGRVLARHASGGPVAAVRGRLTATPHPLVATLTRQLDAFARAVRGEGRGALASARDAEAVMGVVDAVRVCAADAGRLVRVPHRQDC